MNIRVNLIGRVDILTVLILTTRQRTIVEPGIMPGLLLARVVHF